MSTPYKLYILDREDNYEGPRNIYKSLGIDSETFANLSGLSSSLNDLINSKNNTIENLIDYAILKTNDLQVQAFIVIVAIKRIYFSEEILSESGWLPQLGTLNVDKRAVLLCIKSLVFMNRCAVYDLDFISDLVDNFKPQTNKEFLEVIAVGSLFLSYDDKFTSYRKPGKY